jgi:hypothetical protein
VTDKNRFTYQLAHIDSTNSVEAEKTTLFTVDEHKSYLIHVSGQHHSQALFSPPGLSKPGGQHIAKGIHFNLINMGSNFFQDDRSDFALVT